MLELNHLVEYQTEGLDVLYYRAATVAHELIDFYDLHREPDEPVDINALVDKFDVRFLDLPATTLGFTLDMEPKIIIALNDKLPTDLTRYVAAHEVGHIACWHPNAVNSCVEGQWLQTPLEVEATVVAASLLLPASAIMQSVTRSGRVRFHGIAEHYIVPPELVFIRFELYRRTGF